MEQLLSLYDEGACCSNEACDICKYFIGGKCTSKSATPVNDYEIVGADSDDIDEEMSVRR